MKFKHIASLMALAGLATGASATVTDWGVHAPVEHGSDTFAAGYHGAFSDFYTFTLPGPSDLDDMAVTFDLGKLSNISKGELELWSGTIGNATEVGSFDFDHNLTTGSFNNLTGGSYYYEVQGHVPGLLGGAYRFTSTMAPVPEPGSAALLIAGLGLMGFIGRRRKSR